MSRAGPAVGTPNSVDINSNKEKTWERSEQNTTRQLSSMTSNTLTWEKAAFDMLIINNYTVKKNVV